jgi:transcriptional regulator with XRE-family HTH domain
MSIKFEDFLARLPQQERQAIEARAAELIQEEATLRGLREAHDRSQREIAERLNIQQAAVSKLERRTDMYISTLRNFVRAMGGDLEIIARFPDRSPVRITQFRRLEAETVPSR